MEKVYYMGFYSDPDVSKSRRTAPSADTKMDYLIESIKKCGYDVEIISFCIDDDRSKLMSIKRGYKTRINGVNTIYFTNYASKLKLIRVIGRFIAWLRIKKYLIDKCLDNKSIILVYHSLGLMQLYNFLIKKKKHFILEMEEIYADVLGQETKKKKELRVAECADGYVFPTRLLDDAVNTKHKPSAIVHGTYHVEPSRDRYVFNDDVKNSSKIIHCVYAGTLDPRKGGAIAAAAAAEYLPFNYHIHILGFGGEKEIQEMKELVKDVQSRSRATVSYDGLLTGEDYVCFIQSCDIGLSTQDPSAVFNATSFPSKILSYLANGLRVVSIRIPAIETSDISELLYYYDRQTPEEIARAILSVNLDEPYNSRESIMALSRKFNNELINVLNAPKDKV